MCGRARKAGVQGCQNGLTLSRTRDLRLKADVAQQMCIKLAKALAITAAGGDDGDGLDQAQDNARTGAQRKGRGMAVGHCCLLRFVLIQFTFA
jgi:hypothetical protein